MQRVAKSKSECFKGIVYVGLKGSVRKFFNATKAKAEVLQLLFAFGSNSSIVGMYLRGWSKDSLEYCWNVS